MNKEWILSLKNNVLETTAIYLYYIENYSSTWDDNSKQISEETLGKLIIFTHQIKDIEDYNFNINDDQKTIITNCLFEIDNYVNHVKSSLINII